MLDKDKKKIVSIEELFITGVDELDNSKAFIELRNPFSKSIKKDKSLYLLEFLDNTIKIGVSQDPNKRIKTIINQSGRILKNKYITPIISNAFKIESKMKNKYKQNRLNGEYFKVSYEKVKKEIIKEIENYGK